MRVLSRALKFTSNIGRASPAVLMTSAQYYDRANEFQRAHRRQDRPRGARPYLVTRLKLWLLLRSRDA